MVISFSGKQLFFYIVLYICFYRDKSNISFRDTKKDLHSILSLGRQLFYCLNLILPQFNSFVFIFYKWCRLREIKNVIEGIRGD
jgi:hypothetical protein